MKHILSLLIVLLPCAPMRAQQPTFPSLLREILRNNTSLRTLRADLQSTRQENAAAMVLPDPEAEVSHDFGSPKGVPARTNVSVSQQLDWGVLTGRRRRLARVADDAAHLAYRLEAQRVAGEADEALVRVIYSNRLVAELARRDTLAASLQSLYESKYAKGDITLLELNKVRLTTSVARAERQRALSERQSVLAELQRLNGGQPVELSDTIYPYDASTLPPLSTLQSILESGIAVQAAETAVRRSEAEAALAKSAGWPSFSVGFQGEYVRDNNYNGFSLGVSLPLWGGKRRQLRSARTKVQAARLDVADVRLQQSARLSQQYATSVSLAESADRLDRDLQATSNAALLHKSLAAGQISLLDYLLESSFYYSARTAQLEAERDAQLSLSALRVLLYDGTEGEQ